MLFFPYFLYNTRIIVEIIDSEALTAWLPILLCLSWFGSVSDTVGTCSLRAQRDTQSLRGAPGSLDEALGIISAKHRALFSAPPSKDRP